MKPSRPSATSSLAFVYTSVHSGNIWARIIERVTRVCWLGATRIKDEADLGGRPPNQCGDDSVAGVFAYGGEVFLKMFARDLTYFRYSINVFLGPRTLSREEYHGTRDVDVLCLVWCGARETGRGERGKAHEGREGGTRPTDVKRDASIHEARCVTGPPRRRGRSSPIFAGPQWACTCTDISSFALPAHGSSLAPCGRGEATIHCGQCGCRHVQWPGNSD